MAGGGFSDDGRPPVYKAVGVALAISSGVFIGVSFVLKKKGLLAANIKEGKEAGEGYGYLKNAWWWTGMILMILGEICNFAAYAFVEAILVTPLGALSVVITAVLSSIFLKERLSFVGKIGCFSCLLGSIVIVVNAPSQTSVKTIQDMQKFVISPGFLSYAGIVIVGCTGIIWFIAPKYGNKSMMVYLTVCSLIGGLSVVATQGLGAAIVTQASGVPQFNQWFLYVLLVFVVSTLLVEIVYLNKALNIFNAALVTPTYYVFFTSATIVTSAILFRGFKGSPSSIATVVLGFLQICSGVVLLQLSKSAKDVPDTAVFRGDLDQVRTVAEQEEPESEPKADTIRGTAAIIRRISVARRTAEVEEARRIHEDRMRDLHTPLSAGESVEWDGLRRRVTYTGDNPLTPGRRRNTLSGQHPPLGMSRIPDIRENEVEETPAGRRRSMSVDEAMRQRAYPDLESALPEPPGPDAPQHHQDSFLERVRSLFVAKQRSQTSLTVPGEDPPGRDISPSGAVPAAPALRRPRVNTDSGKAPFLKGYDSHPATQSAPHVHVHFSDSPTEPKTMDFAHPLPVVRTNSRDGNEYTAVPSQPLYSSTPPPRPESSRSGAKRQFSFQSLLPHHPRSSSGETHRPSFFKKPTTSEEEAAGLVKGDKIASADQMEMSEKAQIKLVPSEGSEASRSSAEERRYNEKGKWEQ